MKKFFKIKYCICFLLINMLLFGIRYTVKKVDNSYAYSEYDNNSKAIIESYYEDSCLLIVGNTLFTENNIGPNKIALAGTLYAKNNGYDISSLSESELSNYYNDISYIYCGVSYKLNGEEEDEVQRYSKYSNVDGKYVLMDSDEINTIFNRVGLIKYINNELINNNYTIVNVPLDSRPVTRNNLKNLALSGGMNYVELGSNYLDSNVDGYSINSNYTYILNELDSKLEVYNNSNTKVILNLTSLFFGGLISENTSHDNSVIENNVNKLKDTIINNNNIDYYITLISPRIMPDNRMGYYKYGNEEIDINNLYVKGLSYYYYESLNDNEKNSFVDNVCTSGGYCFKINDDPMESLSQALMQYEYVKSYLSNKYPDGLDENVQESEGFLYTFYNEFNTSESITIYSYEDSNNVLEETINGKELFFDFVSDYEKIFETNKSYINKIIDLQDDYSNIHFIYGFNDYEIPNIIKYLISKEGNNLSGIKTKYNILNYKGNGDSIENIVKDLDTFACDEVNHIIVSKLALENYNKNLSNKVSVEYNIIDFNDDLLIGDYDYFSNKNFYNNTLSFINNKQNYSKKITNDIYIYNNLNNKFNINNESEYNDSHIILLNSNINYSFVNPFDLGIITGWNTNDNSIGIGLSKGVVFDILNEQFKNADVNKLSKYDKKRIEELIKLRLNNYIEDRYNFIRDNSDLGDERNYTCSFKNREVLTDNNSACNYFNEEINTFLPDNTSDNTYISFLIGNLEVKINCYEYTISYPWNRDFEILVTTDNIDYEINNIEL